MHDRESREDDEWLTTELAELIESGARLGHGLGFVRQAPLETVATLLGVHARTVDRARECLGDPALRDRLVAAYARASERPAPPSSVPSSSRSGSALLDVIGGAEQHPLGVQFLLCAPLETVAISFGVHPDVVGAARGELARRGILPEATEV